jgi:hypothetical protein
MFRVPVIFDVVVHTKVTNPAEFIEISGNPLLKRTCLHGLR